MEEKYLKHVLHGNIPKFTQLIDQVITDKEEQWLNYYSYLDEKIEKNTEADAAQRIFAVLLSAIYFIKTSSDHTYKISCQPHLQWALSIY